MDDGGRARLLPERVLHRPRSPPVTPYHRPELGWAYDSADSRNRKGAQRAPAGSSVSRDYSISSRSVASIVCPAASLQMSARGFALILRPRRPDHLINRIQRFPPCRVTIGSNGVGYACHTSDTDRSHFDSGHFKRYSTSQPHNSCWGFSAGSSILVACPLQRSPT